MSKQLTHARNVFWHGQAWSVIVVVDTFSALLRGSGSVLILDLNADSKANPLPPSQNKSAIGGRNLFVDDP